MPSTEAGKRNRDRQLSFVLGIYGSLDAWTRLRIQVIIHKSIIRRNVWKAYARIEAVILAAPLVWERLPGLFSWLFIVFDRGGLAGGTVAGLMFTYVFFATSLHRL